MSAFGERLRREREMRGVSLDEIAAATKIGTRLLRALEEEQFDLLPGGIFNKGFVRAYAKYLGIDEEAAVADYLNASGPRDPDLRVIAAQNASEYSPRANAVSAIPARTSFPFVPVLVVIAVVATSWGAWHTYQERQHQVAAKSSVAQAATPATSATDGAKIDPAASAANPEPNVGVKASPPAHQLATENPQTTDQSAVTSTTSASEHAPRAGHLIAATTPDETSATPFEIIVKAKDRAWVSIKSDGKIMVRGIIKPPDIKTIHATDQVVFWTGNAGDVAVSFNGRDVPLSGGQNAEAVLVFNSRGLLPQQAAQ